MIQIVGQIRAPIPGMSNPIHLRSMWLIGLLGFGIACHSTGPAAAENARPAGSQASDQPAGTHNHTVKLSWGPSAPATKLPRDAVVGYNVYRSTVSHDRNPARLNSKPLPDTTYIDTDVEAGKTYFYVTRGVTAKGVESGPSNEFKVVMPPR